MKNFHQSRIKSFPCVSLFKLFIVLVLIGYLIVANFSDPKNYHQPENSLMSYEETFQFRNHTKNLDKNISNFKNDKKTKWNLPHIVWVFRNVETIEKFNTFRQLNVLNTKRFAEQGNYLIKQINQENYHHHLTNKSSQKISLLIKLLEERLEDKEYQNSHKQIFENKELIIKRLIIYLVLLENGGIFVDEMTTVVEEFDTWIEDIMNIVDINLGDRNDPNFKPKCFGFYNNEFSSMRMKVDVKREFELEKKMVVFPSLEDDLIACEKQTEFMTKLVGSYLEILFLGKKSMSLQKLNKNQKFIGHTNQWQTYKYGHRLALHSILQQRQHFLNQQSRKQFKNLAIDDYGFVTINENIALHKLKNNLEVQRELFAFLAKLQLKYLSQLNGRLRFAHKLNPNIIALFTQQLASELKPPEFFLQNSFFHTYLLRFWPKGQKFNDYKYLTPFVQDSLKSKKQMIELSEPQILPEPIEQNNENNPQWQSVEKNLWVTWDKNLKGNSNLITELCFQNLKKSAAKSGYKLIFVTKQTLHEYIDKQTLQRMDYALKHSNYGIQIQGQSDLWRLALMYKHGGVYVDASTFTTEESFDFVQNITRIPSGLLWNRYGQHPKHLLFWHVRFAHPSNWQIDYKYNTKKQWELSYESSFIAAEKGSEMIKEWLDVYMQWMTADYEKIQAQMKEIGMWDHKWTRKGYRYLMVMDAIKYVVGRRQKQLKDTNNSQYQSASDYYKIWSMPAQMNGQQKLRGETNYENKDYRQYWGEGLANNLYRHEFSLEHAQQVLGPLSFETKFFGYDSKYVNMFLQEFAMTHKHALTEEALNQIIHPQSLLGRLIRIDINKTIQVMKYYSRLREIRTINRANKVWIPM